MNGEAERPEPEQAESETPEAAEDEQREQDATEDSVDVLQAKVDENWDKYVRAAAELENVRKRAARDVENAHKFALERFAGDLLSVCDSLDMALDAEQTIESLQAGNEATQKQLKAVLNRFGVEEIDPLGEPFNPERHEAMTMQPSADVEPGSVLTVFQKGFVLNGRLLRPARVVVASAADDDSETG